MNTCIVLLFYGLCRKREDRQQADQGARRWKTRRKTQEVGQLLVHPQRQAAVRETLVATVQNTGVEAFASALVFDTVRSGRLSGTLKDMRSLVV